MAPIAVDPNALSGAGASVGAVGDGLSAALSTLAGSFDANTGADSAGVVFGQQYVAAADGLLKAVSAGVNACRQVGYGIQMTAVNYSRAEANSDVSGRSQPLAPPRCPAPASPPGSPSATGGGVAEPALWRVVAFLVGDVWPSGDPAAMRAAAAAWRAFGTPLYHVSADMSGAYNTIAAQQMAEAELIQKPIRDIGTSFSSVASGCEQVVTGLEQFAGEVASTQQAIRGLLNKLGSIGGIVGTFFEFVKGHGEDELHEIADEIKTVLHHLKAEADAKKQILEQAKAAVDHWALSLQGWADREFVDFFGEDVGTALATDFNLAVDAEEGGFRWLVSTGEGLAALDPTRFAYDPEGAKQTWQGLADFAGTLTNPVGTYVADPAKVNTILKGLARTDEWNTQRPMVALTENFLDLATLGVPGVGEAGAGVDAASAAGRVARGAEVAGDAGAAARSVGKLSEISRGAAELGDVSKNAAGVADKLDAIANKPVTAEAPPPGGRPLPLDRPSETGGSPVAKHPVDGHVPNVERPTHPETLKSPAGPASAEPVVAPTAAPHPPNAGEPAAVASAESVPAANFAHSLPTAAAAAERLPSIAGAISDAAKPVGSAMSSATDAISGLGRGGPEGDLESLGHRGHAPDGAADASRRDGGGAGSNSDEPNGDGWHRREDEPIDPEYGLHELDDHWAYAEYPENIDPAVRDLISDPDAPWGRDAQGNPLPQERYEELFNKLGPDGDHWHNYPPNAGAIPGTRLIYHSMESFTRDYGSAVDHAVYVDRLGGDDGAYLGVMPEGKAPVFEERSLPVESLTHPYNPYAFTGELPDGWTIEASQIAPAFGREGGGVQILFFDTKGRKVTVEILKELGMLR